MPLAGEVIEKAEMRFTEHAPRDDAKATAGFRTQRVSAASCFSRSRAKPSPSSSTRSNAHKASGDAGRSAESIIIGEVTNFASLLAPAAMKRSGRIVCHSRGVPSGGRAVAPQTPMRTLRVP